MHNLFIPLFLFYTMFFVSADYFLSKFAEPTNLPSQYLTLLEHKVRTVLRWPSLPPAAIWTWHTYLERTQAAAPHQWVYPFFTVSLPPHTYAKLPEMTIPHVTRALKEMMAALKPIPFRRKKTIFRFMKNWPEPCVSSNVTDWEWKSKSLQLLTLKS